MLHTNEPIAPAAAAEGRRTRRVHVLGSPVPAGAAPLVAPLDPSACRVEVVA